MAHIVFICTANVCRSPMAEGIFRHLAETGGRSNLTTSSMGIHGLDGQPASPLAQEVCSENGVDISAHLSRPLGSEELRESDLILCMEPVHKKFLDTFFPWNRDRTFLLGAWPGKQTRRSAVEDPVGAPKEAFRHCYSILHRHISRVLEHL